MKNILFCLLLSCVAILNAQENTPESLIKDFFEKVEKGESVPALDQLYSTNSWAAQNKEAIDNLKSQMGNLDNLLGKYYSNELLVKKAIGKRFVLYSYVVYYELQPMRFIFQFYKPGDKWKTFAFSFDENLDEELEESAKLTHILKD